MWDFVSFEEKVWTLIERIPRGRVTTYKIIAEKLGTKAYRAVGIACRTNPDAPHVPCHRVVNSDGRVGGYAYGQERKVRLLTRENVKVAKGRVVGCDRILFRF